MRFGWNGKRFCHFCGKETEWDFQRATVEQSGSSFEMLVPVCKQCGYEVGSPKRISPRIVCTEAVPAQL